MVLNSTDFFTSAGVAVKRLAAAPKVASLNGITVAAQLLGTTCITGVGACVSMLAVRHLHWYTDESSGWFLENPLFIVVVASFMSFTISTAFMFMFDMTSDTLLFCWLVDREDGDAEYAPKSLRDEIGAPKRVPQDQQGGLAELASIFE